MLKNKKSPLSVDLRRSKTPFLKLPIYTCITFGTLILQEPWNFFVILSMFKMLLEKEICELSSSFYLQLTAHLETRGKGKACL